VRWTMPEEDRHEVDRVAIRALFGAAAEVKLEGRVIPVVRSRAEGISQETSMAAKVEAWANVTQVKAEGLLACLSALHTSSPEEIASRIVEHAGERAQPENVKPHFRTNPVAPDNSAQLELA